MGLNYIKLNDINVTAAAKVQSPVSCIVASIGYHGANQLLVEALGELPTELSTDGYKYH